MKCQSDRLEADTSADELGRLKSKLTKGAINQNSNAGVGKSTYAQVASQLREAHASCQALLDKCEEEKSCSAMVPQNRKNPNSPKVPAKEIAIAKERIARCKQNVTRNVQELAAAQNRMQEASGESAKTGEETNGSKASNPQPPPGQIRVAAAAVGTSRLLNPLRVRCRLFRRCRSLQHKIRKKNKKHLNRVSPIARAQTRISMCAANSKL